MAVDFGALRKSGGNNMAKLQKSLEKSERSFDDPRIWKYEKNQKDEFVGRIRFLPVPAVDMEMVEAGNCVEEDLSPMVKVLRHQFKGLGGKFLNKNSPQTFGEPDPIRDWSGPQWGELKKLGEKHPDYERRKKELMEYMPSEEYYTNILILEDGTHPENNGKVFLFKFGRAIRKLIDAASEPPFGAAPFDPFDPFEGRVLELRMTFQERAFNGRNFFVPDFAKCEWSKDNTPIDPDEAKIEEIWRQAHSLQEFHDRSKYPTYEELKAEFCKVMNFDEDFNPIVKGATPSAHQIPSSPATSNPAASPAAQSLAQASQPESNVPGANATPAATPAVVGEDLDSLRDLLK